MTDLLERFSSDIRSMDFDAIRTLYVQSIIPELLKKSARFDPNLTVPEQRVLEILRRDGICPYEFINSADARALYSELAALPVQDGHVATASKGVEFKTYADVTSENYSHYTKSILLSSNLIQRKVLANHRLQCIADAYLGAPSNLYDVGCFWSYPEKERHPFSQMWHRDWDDYRFLVLFTFLTDVVDESDGAHKFILGSHLPELPNEFAGKTLPIRLYHRLASGFQAVRFGLRQVRGYTGSAFADMGSAQYFGKRKLHPYYETLLKQRVKVITGPCGTSFFEDAGGLHLGDPPLANPRLLLWVRFGVSRAPLAEVIH